MADLILDASALLAALNDEPGGSRVASELERSAISTINWSEVAQKSLARGVDNITSTREDLERLGLDFIPFSAADADATAELWGATHNLGLSLGDRACLALAQRMSLPALTADRTWMRLKLPVSIELIR